MMKTKIFAGFQARSLKTRVTLFTLAIFVSSIWTLALYASHALRQDMQRLLGEQQFSSVSLLAKEVNQQISERLRALEVVAGQLTSNSIADARVAQRFLESSLTLQGHFNGGVTILRRDGTAIADVPLAAGRVGINFGDTEVTASALRGQAAISRPMMGKSARAPLIVMSVPIHDSAGQVIGALSGLVNLGKDNFLDLVTDSAYGKTGGYLLAAPQYRLVVTATDKSRVMAPLPPPGVNPMIDRFVQGYEGSMVGISSLGVEVLSSAKRVPVTDWYLVAQLPSAEAFAPIVDMQIRMFLATIFLTALAAGLTWWMLKRQLSPLFVAVKTLACAAGGTERVEPLHISQQDEIGELIASFNRLLQRLDDRESALRESEERHRTLVEWSPEAIAVYRKGRLVYVNPVAIKLFAARDDSELLGKEVTDFVHPEFRQSVAVLMESQAESNLTSMAFEGKFCKLDGTVMELELQSRLIIFDGARGIYMAMRDVTASKQAQREIETLAFFDTLTGLPNRRLLIDRLEQSLAASSRHNREGALLFIDLDNFKNLNDTLGHDQGDILLQQVGKRLTECMREGDTVARFGGDEFVVILEDLSENAEDAAAQAEVVGEKIRTSLGQPYHLPVRDYHTTPSIGITLFSDHEETVAELLRRADLAMYQAKEAGRNMLRFFDPAMQAILSARQDLQNDLYVALAENQFSLHYQPQVTGERHLIGAEALLRWLHPQKGSIPPSDFIALAETSGLIVLIGKWVLESACLQLATWSTQAGREHLTISVNVSARQFHQDDFVGMVLDVLKKTGARPNRLKLELTESLMATNVESLIAKMNTLKAMGVGFSMDDFGTGYSSLSYLKLLPLDQLKIDQSFVRDILVDPNDAAIAKMVIVLAESLGLAVIAEGVETQEQRIFLAEHGCNTYQGYLFGRPLPIKDFEVICGSLQTMIF
jgi:diguanylate cyclase (GGDEF)-like protein/PAS domain S-box-containing protein